MKTVKSIAVATALAFSAVTLGACSSSDRMTTTEMVATGVGMAVGGFIGWQYFGAGAGRYVTAAVGAAVGGGAGYFGSKLLTGSDRRKAEDAANWALANAPDGMIQGWVNPETGNAGVFKPLNTYAKRGKTCRDFYATLEVESEFAHGTGTACKGSDGRWQQVA